MSVFLAVLMLLTACLPAFHGSAAVIVYSEQYNALATLLANEHVRDLNNYEIENKKSEDIVTEGFNTDAGAFAYSHTVYAKDDVENSILKAANRFYYIAESVMSYTHGVGIYSAELLYAEIQNNLKPYFDKIKDSGWLDMNNQPVTPTVAERNKYYEVMNQLGNRFDKDNLITMGVTVYYSESIDYYVDVYGNRFYPTDEELETYDEAVAEFIDRGATPTINDMTERGINFVKVNPYDYYNVAAILRYFMGTGSYTNAGNWYHDFDFIVTTDTETVLMAMDSLNSYADNVITVTTGIYRFRYQRQYAANGTTAQYFFKPVDNRDTYVQYGVEYNLASSPAKLSYLEEGEGTVGQAAYFYTAERKDESTIPELISMNNMFNSIFYSKPSSAYATLPSGYNPSGYNYYIGDTWDSQFLLFTNDQLNHLDEYKQTVNQIDLYRARQAAESLTQMYSNDVLIHLFPGTIGNIKNLQYQLTAGNAVPSRTVRGEATYTASISRLDSIVFQFDALFTNEDVMSTVNMFLSDTMNDLFEGTPAEGHTYSTAQDLVKVLLKGMLYSDDMCTMVVSGLYPLLANLLLDLFEKAEGFSGTLNSLVNWALSSLNAALTPGDLADFLTEYPSAYAALKAAGSSMDSWNNVRWGNVTWEKRDGTKITDRETFAAALSATFRGLRVAVLCLFCNDDKWRLGLLGEGVNIREQAGYRDLLLPLLEALGLQQAAGAANNDNLAAGLCYSAEDYKERAHEERLNGDSYLLDILIPLLKWVEEIVAIKPIETICQLLPNLVNFIIRDTGDNLLDCINKVEIQIYTTSFHIVTLKIPELLGDIGTALDSLNHLLAELIGFSVKDEEGNEIPYYLPKIHEKKLIESGTMNERHTIDVEHPGYVFLFLLRYVLTAVGYRYDISNEKLPYVIECLGISMDGELFMGMTFGDLIYNIMLHPDEALCALLELFYPNEYGNLYEDVPYTYPLSQIRFYQNTLLNKTLNPRLSYGAPVIYSELWTQSMATEVVHDLGPLVDNVLKLIGVEGMEDGLSAFLEDLIYGYISDDTVNMLFNMLYQLLSGVDGSLGDINVIALLDHIFSVEFTPDRAARRVYAMLGYEPQYDLYPEVTETEETPAEGEGTGTEEPVQPLASYTTLYSMQSWDDVFAPYTYDPDLGTDVRVLTDANYNWGISEAEEHGMTKGEAFIRVLSALLSPASFIFEFLMLDQPLSVFGLISLPSYAGYQYTFIALLELLTCPANMIATYDEYYEATIKLKETGYQADLDLAECNTFYYILKPILGLVDKAIADPVNTVFNLLPNLMFFISIGAMNDLVNNLVHFAYILLDIVKPIFNAYDLVNDLLSNIDLGGFTLNLSLPLDIDFNSVISGLLGSLLGSAIVLGTKEVKDENGNVIGEEDITLTLPYIDFYTLCAGSLERFDSKEMRRIVRLDAAGGGDLLTALLRLVVSVLFMEENLDAVISLLFTVSTNFDEYDKETIEILLSELSTMMTDTFGIESIPAEDLIMVVLYHLITKVTSLSTTLVDLLADSGLTIMDLVAVIGSIGSVEDIGILFDFIDSLGNDDPYQPDNNEDGIPDDPQSGGGVDNGAAAMSIFDKIKAFFEKIILFIKKTLGLA